MNLKPLYDKIIVRRIKEDEKIGSFYVPETAKEKPAEGEVLAVGPGRILTNSVNLAPLSVRVGQRVVFGKYNGVEIIDTDTAEKLLVLREDEILVTRELVN